MKGFYEYMKKLIHQIQSDWYEKWYSILACRMTALILLYFCEAMVDPTRSDETDVWIRSVKFCGSHNPLVDFLRSLGRTDMSEFEFEFLVSDAFGFLVERVHNIMEEPDPRRVNALLYKKVYVPILRPAAKCVRGVEYTFIEETLKDLTTVV